MPNIDADPRNADWLRGRSWDITVTDEDGTVRFVETLADLFRAFPDTRNKGALRGWMAYPSAQAMPAALRREVEAYLRAP